MKIFGFEINRVNKKPEPTQSQNISGTIQRQVVIPPNRKSQIISESGTFDSIINQAKFVNPAFLREAIPVIRRLSMVNPDLGLAVHDMIQLTNTGHIIHFDKGVSDDQIDSMRKHIIEKSLKWGDGVAGIEGLVNKMISQIWVSGALSIEWVPQIRNRGIDNLVLVNPETIVFAIEKGRFIPYQKLDMVGNNVDISKTHVKLNQNTFKYYGMNGDTEIPYGIPPFLTALESISVQKDMSKNIRFIMKQLGLMGFFETLLEKPSQNLNESESQYIARLEKLLDDTKRNLETGMKDGIMVGYKEDHEFTFHNTTTNMQSVPEIFNQNEQQIANGLKTAPQFLGISSSGTETGITVVFTKMLSQLSNVQMMVAKALEYGYSLELRMAGFKFNTLKVEFNASTITDDLKMQQAQEIKIRNQRTLYADGIISQETYADAMGYEKPDQLEPRVPIDPNDVQDGVIKKRKREGDKDTSDRRGRDKKKTVPKRGDQKTKPV